MTAMMSADPAAIAMSPVVCSPIAALPGGDVALGSGPYRLRFGRLRRHARSSRPLRGVLDGEPPSLQRSRVPLPQLAPQAASLPGPQRRSPEGRCRIGPDVDMDDDTVGELLEPHLGGSDQGAGD